MKNIKLFEQFDGIEDKPRLTDKVTKLLNEQIKNELESSQIYRSMSCWTDDKGWIGASKYYFNSAKEELTHMDKLYEYLFDKNCKAVVPTVSDVDKDFKDIKTIVQTSLDHEIKVTEQWNEIANTALAEKDNDTYALAQWYLKEQIEEEDKFRNFLYKIRLDMPKYEIDEMFGE